MWVAEKTKDIIAMNLQVQKLVPSDPPPPCLQAAARKLRYWRWERLFQDSGTHSSSLVLLAGTQVYLC